MTKTITDVDLAEIEGALLLYELHPNGVCLCGGEGKCDWCKLSNRRDHAIDCGCLDCRMVFQSVIRKLQAHNSRLAYLAPLVAEVRRLNSDLEDMTRKRNFWHDIAKPTEVTYEASDVSQLRERVKELERQEVADGDKINEWKDATGLIDSGGDPSGIEPLHLGAHLDRIHVALRNIAENWPHEDTHGNKLDIGGLHDPSQCRQCIAQVGLGGEEDGL